MGLFIGDSVYIRQAIACQSPSSSRGAAVAAGASPGGAAPARAGDIRLDMHNNAVASSRALARRDVRPTCYIDVKTGLAAPGEAELPRERLSQTRNAAYDAARFAARVISSFRHALKSMMFLKRVRRRRGAIAFCPRLLQPSSLSSKGPLAEARPF